MNKITFKSHYEETWIQSLMDLHNKTEMKRTDAGRVNAAFKRSTAVMTGWLGERLIACGRVISDGMYSSIFDVVIDPEFQKQGIGRTILEKLIAEVPGTHIHLTSTFGNEAFYYKLGFRKHKTAMALYQARKEPTPYLDYEWAPIASL